MTAPLDVIRQRLEKATKGTWTWFLNTAGAPVALSPVEGPDVLRASSYGGMDDEIEVKKADADFIAHAPEDIAYLLAQIDAQAQVIATLQAEKTETGRRVSYLIKAEADAHYVRDIKGDLAHRNWLALADEIKSWSPQGAV